MYTVDYFIQKFEAIPEDLFCIGRRSIDEQRCVLGWCYPSKEDALRSQEEMFFKSDEDISLTDLILTINGRCRPAGINNGIYPEYQQPTPKQRILAALYDIKKMQQPEYVDITKSLAVLPVEETADKPFTHA